MKVGEPMGLKPGHTSTIRRIEGGMLSYHADMTINTNPLELGLDKFIDLGTGFDFVGKDALISILDKGIKRKQVGIIIDDDPMPGPNTRFWNIYVNDSLVGKITSAVYSPRLDKNIALGMVKADYSNIGQELTIDNGIKKLHAVITEKPFYDPNKSLTKA